MKNEMNNNLYIDSSIINTPGKTFKNKLDWLQSNIQSDSCYLVEIYEDDVIKPQIFSWDDKSNVSIVLKGVSKTRMITLSENGTLFDIGKGITLILDNFVTLKGKTNNNGPLVVVSGKLILNEGSSIIDNENCGVANIFAEGGGVLVWNEFIMNGGNISGNKASYGGGVALYGKESTFIMYDGTISGNMAADSGGGISIGTSFDSEGCKFTMNGGNIIGNTADYSGGVGVLGCFLMNDGIISDNIARDGEGGGVGIAKGEFIMKGGTISRNIAQSVDDSVGGGVKLSGGLVHNRTLQCRFTKNGGIITGYSSDSVNGNVVKIGARIVNDKGHAVLCGRNGKIELIFDKTLNEEDNVYFDTNKETTTGDSGCYIATVVYGSYEAPQVVSLRRFRDEYLSGRYLGRLLIRNYYRIGPSIAERLKGKEVINKLIRIILDKIILKSDKIWNIQNKYR